MYVCRAHTCVTAIRGKISHIQQAPLAPGLVSAHSFPPSAHPSLEHAAVTGGSCLRVGCSWAHPVWFPLGRLSSPIIFVQFIFVACNWQFFSLCDFPL